MTFIKLNLPPKIQGGAYVWWPRIFLCPNILCANKQILNSHITWCLEITVFKNPRGGGGFISGPWTITLSQVGIVHRHHFLLSNTNYGNNYSLYVSQHGPAFSSYTASCANFGLMLRHAGDTRPTLSQRWAKCPTLFQSLTYIIVINSRRVWIHSIYCRPTHWWCTYSIPVIFIHAHTLSAKI